MGRQVVMLLSMEDPELLANHRPFYFRSTSVPPPPDICFDGGGRE